MLPRRFHGFSVLVADARSARQKEPGHDDHPQPDEQRRRRGDIARLLDVLDLELAKHAEDAAADPKTWGRVGDLTSDGGSLITTVATLSSMDPAKVEAFLAE